MTLDPRRLDDVNRVARAALSRLDSNEPEPAHDPIKHPSHYANGRFGDVECIDFTRHMTFPAGSLFKYVWRHELKGKPVEDLRKALQYLEWAREDNYPAVLPFMPSARAIDYVRPYLGSATGVYLALENILTDNWDAVYGIISTHLGQLEWRCWGCGYGPEKPHGHGVCV